MYIGSVWNEMGSCIAYNLFYYFHYIDSISWFIIIIFINNDFKRKTINNNLISFKDNKRESILYCNTRM